MKKMLFAASALVVGASSALAAPGSVATGPTVAPLLQEKIKVVGATMKVFGPSREVYRESERVFYKGDLSVQGTLKNPARLESGQLSVVAGELLYSPQNAALHAFQTVSGGGVKISGVFVPRSNRNSIRLEVTCERAKLTRSVWTLEGKVSGFYEDSSGRQPLSGELVKLSAFDNAISIVQDGAISLSDDAVR